MTVLLSCQNLEKSYSSRPLFKGLTFGIFEGDRIGVIGANGSGKSTLLRILAGAEEPDGGEVVRKRFLKLAYVQQQWDFPLSKTAFETLSAIGKQNGIPDADIENAAHRVLSQVGFNDPHEKLTNLSGGWRKRLQIAGGLIQEPDVLLLDEPTNHLDIESVLWLERLLKSARFAWAVISHDRYFLEQTVKKIVEISPIYTNGLLLSEGRYGDFLQKRSDYLSEQASYAASLANKVQREVEWLRQGAKARTTKAKYRVDEAQNLQNELANVKARLKQNTVDIEFTGSQRKTRKLMEAEKISLTLGDKPLFKNLSFTLTPGMCLGILGPNGSGKSSLLKVMTGELTPESGTLKHADNLKWVYFEQSRASLDPGKTLKRTLAEEGDAVVYRGRSIHVTSWARRFQFRNEQLDLPVGELSGGEQARVLIARLMLQPADVLLLDEPTNDLDIPTLEVLEEGLSDFPGAIVLVSHDRYLMDRLGTIFIGLNGNGTSQVYADYFQWQESLKSVGAQPKEKEIPGSNRPRNSATKRLSYMEQREYDGMESEITKAEAELAKAAASVEDPAIATQTSKLMEATTALEAAQRKVEALYARWSELEDKLK